MIYSVFKNSYGIPVSHFQSKVLRAAWHGVILMMMNWIFIMTRRSIFWFEGLFSHIYHSSQQVWQWTVNVLQSKKYMLLLQCFCICCFEKQIKQHDSAVHLWKKESFLYNWPFITPWSTMAIAQSYIIATVAMQQEWGDSVISLW